MKTIYSKNADGVERYDTVRPEIVARKIKELRRNSIEVRVI